MWVCTNAKKNPEVTTSLFCELYKDADYSAALRKFLGQIVFSDPPQQLQDNVKGLVTTLLADVRRKDYPIPIPGKKPMSLLEMLKFVIDHTFQSALSKLWLYSNVEHLTFEYICEAPLQELESLLHKKQITYNDLFHLLDLVIQILRILSDIKNVIMHIQDGAQLPIGQHWFKKVLAKRVKQMTKKVARKGKQVVKKVARKGKQATKKVVKGSKRVVTGMGRGVAKVVTAPIAVIIRKLLQQAITNYQQTLTDEVTKKFGISLRVLGYIQVGKHKYTKLVPECNEDDYKRTCNAQSMVELRQLSQCTSKSQDLYCRMHHEGGSGLRRLLQELILEQHIPPTLAHIIESIFKAGTLPSIVKKEQHASKDYGWIETMLYNNVQQIEYIEGCDPGWFPLWVGLTTLLSHLTGVALHQDTKDYNQHIYDQWTQRVADVNVGVLTTLLMDDTDRQRQRQRWATFNYVDNPTQEHFPPGKFNASQTKEQRQHALIRSIALNPDVHFPGKINPRVLQKIRAYHQPYNPMGQKTWKSTVVQHLTWAVLSAPTLATLKQLLAYMQTLSAKFLNEDVLTFKDFFLLLATILDIIEQLPNALRAVFKRIGMAFLNRGGLSTILTQIVALIHTQLTLPYGISFRLINNLQRSIKK